MEYRHKSIVNRTSILATFANVDRSRVGHLKVGPVYSDRSKSVVLILWIVGGVLSAGRLWSLCRKGLKDGSGHKFGRFCGS